MDESKRVEANAVNKTPNKQELKLFVTEQPVAEAVLCDTPAGDFLENSRRIYPGSGDNVGELSKSLTKLIHALSRVEDETVSVFQRADNHVEHPLQNNCHARGKDNKEAYNSLFMEIVQ
jgi:hypothetical protein